MTKQERVQIYAWLGYWRDKIPPAAVEELQTVMGPLHAPDEPKADYQVQCKCGWIGKTSELVTIEYSQGKNCPKCKASFRTVGFPDIALPENRGAEP